MLAQQPIGVVGIGQMGLAMALRLRDVGHVVWVHDVDAARMDLARDEGLALAANAAEVASQVDVLLLAVVDAAQCDAALFSPGGAAEALRQGSTVVLCSTVSPSEVQAMARLLCDLGVQAVDAPMSGGPHRARDGSMSMMVAASADVLETLWPLLQQLSSRLFKVGEQVGDGAKTKLVNNLLAAIHLAGVAEAMALAERIGLNLSSTLEVIEQSSGQSWIGSERMRRAFQGDLTVRAAMALLAKDSRLAMSMSNQTGLALSVGHAAQSSFDQGCADGFADQDDAQLWRWVQSKNGGAQGGAG